MTSPLMTLRPGREKSLLRRHPWIYSGAVEELKGTPRAGEVVRVVDSHGGFVAYAGVNVRSSIVGRVWSFDESDVIDDEFVADRIRRSVARRTERPGGAQRLVFSESDGVPGVVADCYDNTIVVQFTAAAAERFKDAIVETFASMATSVYERSDVDVRRAENLRRYKLNLSGPEPPEHIEIDECGARYLVDVRHGHKTGFYLDQSENRAAVASLAKGRRVLNLCCYTGAFSVACARAGAATVRSVDSSAPALEMVKRHGELNGVDLHDVVCANVFEYLRELRDREERFDLIVLDPPRLARDMTQTYAAKRGYKDLNWLALRLLDADGYLATFSCSGLVDADLFQKIVAGAALDARREARIVGRFTQGPDHPVLLSYPEAQYLKGLLLRAD